MLGLPSEDHSFSMRIAAVPTESAAARPWAAMPALAPADEGGTRGRTVMPDDRKPALPVSSAIRPSRMCSVPTCDAGWRGAGGKHANAARAGVQRRRTYVPPGGGGDVGGAHLGGQQPARLLLRQHD